MKTLILYATKTGTTREVAGRIAKKFDGAVLHDLKQPNIPSVAEFDRVIVGSSVYAGMIRKEAKTFLTQNTEILKTKTLGLFTCGFDASREKDYFNTNFPADVLQAAKVAYFLGGIFDPEKAGALGRFAIKVIAKQTEYLDNVDNDKIGKFAEILK
jgi:menaquinone-dependent protoporphyrinogen oxidase